MSNGEIPISPAPQEYGDGIKLLHWWLIWLLGGVVAVVSVSIDVLADRPDRLPGRDFTNLWTAGRLVWMHSPQCVFNPACFQAAMMQNLNIASVQNYSYPPSALIIAAPFALAPYYAALIAWTVCGILFFAMAARPYIPRRFPLYLTVLTPAATINIWNGHYGFLYGALWLLFFRNLKARPKVSGIVAGLLTFKPHLGIIVALTALRTRHVIIAALLTLCCLVIATAILFGLDTWRAFLRSTIFIQTGILTSQRPLFYFRMMPSAYVAFGRGLFGALAQVLLAISTVWLLFRYREWDAFSAATATFLVAPYSFNYDMTAANLGLAILLFERWGRFGRTQKCIILVAFFSPELVYFIAPVVPIALLLALRLQLEFANPNGPTKLFGSVGVAYRRDGMDSDPPTLTHVAAS